MITRLIVQRREAFAGGHEFPVTGAYEKLIGRICGEVEPENRLNRVIVNLDKAPRNRRGRVEYRSDICILKPLDMARGNGKIFFDAPNRGSKRILSFLNDAPPTNDPSTLGDAGNGFLMRQGYTVVWCGWQGDLQPGKNWLVLTVPVATNNGQQIVAKVRTEFVVDREGVHSQPLSADDRVKSYEAESRDKSLATLTVREQSYGARMLLSPAEWDFATPSKHRRAGRERLEPSTTDIYVRRGFKPGHIYEFIYPAKNPLVLGLGFAAVRDLLSFLRYDRNDAAGKPNPLANDKDKIGRSRVGRNSHLARRREENQSGERRGEGATSITHVYGWGRSQSGRFLRDLIYHGFNQDAAERKVFDAVAPHVAGGGRLYLNYQFGRPVTSSQQHTNQLDPELFPHTYNVIRDAQSGRRDGILKRPETDPLVFHTQTSTEYWQKRGALAHTDGKGRDLKIPSNVRVYVIASAQHNSPFGSEPVKDDTQLPVNPLPAGDILRALMVALDQWASQDIAPPPSQYPTVDSRTLASPGRIRAGFPVIPGVAFKALYNRQLFLDYGEKILLGELDIHPPRPVGSGAYRILVPKADADGNDVAGIRLPAVQVPLGTYTGWNLRPSGLAEGELAGLLGSFIPFAKTKAERRNSGDPRPSIEERYKNREDYVQQIGRAARLLVEQRFLLPDDAQRMIADAENCKLFQAGKR